MMFQLSDTLRQSTGPSLLESTDRKIRRVVGKIPQRETKDLWTDADSSQYRSRVNHKYPKTLLFFKLKNLPKRTNLKMA